MSGEGPVLDRRLSEEPRIGDRQEEHGEKHGDPECDRRVFLPTQALEAAA